MSDEEEFLAPSLQNIIDNTSLKNIWISGKGGVGKSSTSASLASVLTKHRENVLIVSLDPAHNLSDAFGQQFGNSPTKVDGYDNLYAMEVDNSKMTQSNFTQQLLGQDQAGFTELLSNLPGIDEAMGLFELMKQIDTNNFAVTIFDTSPTGQTLHMMNLPSTMRKLLEKFDGIKDQFGSMFTTVTSLLGANSMNNNDDETQLSLFEKLEDMKEKVQIIESRFQDPNYTTFICVAIPEFLSLFETERLVQELTVLNIDVQNIVVNQVLFPDECSNCRKCKARMKIQSKYLDQMELLYIDFHLVKMPLLDQEIRGKEALEKFGEMLISGKPDPLALSEDL